MADALFSPSWYRVAGLRPRIRAHARIVRQVYRGQTWFVLQDEAGERTHRFTPAAHHVIGLMDGERTVQDIWDATHAALGDEAPNQEEAIRLLGQLHAADVMLCDVPPDTLELFRRRERHQRMAWKRRLWSPLALKFPLIDPDRFLQRTLPWVNPLFSGWGVALWLLVVGAGTVLAASHWTDLSHDVTDRVLTPQNLFLLWLVYPVVKSIHELGHAYAIRRWGGEVHEIGVMLLVLTPVPYVDASASTSFTDKRQRMVVGAAGIAVELFLGSLAMFLWLLVEPGVVKAVCYNVMLICGVSTLLFNGNPLLRFDGYYVLSDALEIPNLGARSNQYLGYLFQRFLLGVADAVDPARTPGERLWMAVYGVASFLYRIFIMFAVILYIAGKFFVVGVLLAIWAVATQLAMPVGKVLSFLLASPTLRRQRGRALASSLALLAVAMLILFVLPAPHWTRAEGVVWVPEEAQVRAGADGFVELVLVAPDTSVEPGQALIQIGDPLLQTRAAVLKAQYLGLKAEHDGLVFSDRVRAAVVAEEMEAAQASLERALERQKEQRLLSPARGRFVVPDDVDLPGRFVTKGQLVGYVVEPGRRMARVVLSQDDIALVRQATRAVEIVPAEWGGEPMAARIHREVPGASVDLPTAALGSAGGGPFATDPRDAKGLRTLSRVFQLELELPVGDYASYLGARVHVRFDHGFEPVGIQLYRSLRRLLLRQFDV